MRVGINSAIDGFGISGTARVAAYIREAVGVAGDMDLVEARPPPPAVSARVAKAASNAYWDLWAAARSAPSLDVFISPCNTGRAPRDLPHVLWIQDTMPIDHPEWFDRRFATYARLFFGLSARSATRVVTASKDSAARIEARWRTARPVEVVPWPAEVRAASPRSLPGSPLNVLMVGGTLFHKNHGATIQAVAILREETGEDIRMTIAGPARAAEAQVQRQALAADPGRRWISREVDVSDARLQELYESAWLLAHPALDEGFGLPVQEAASHALPVVHSGRGPLPEVVSCGNAGSPAAADLARGMRELLDRELYARASAVVLEDARRHPVDGFRRAVAEVVREAAGS